MPKSSSEHYFHLFSFSKFHIQFRVEMLKKYVSWTKRCKENVKIGKDTVESS